MKCTYLYNVPYEKPVLCILEDLNINYDIVKVRASDHPENTSLTILNSIGYLIQSFEEQYPNKKILICYNEINIKSENNKIVFF